MEFHISRNARKKYDFEDSLFSFNGEAIFANFHAARLFTQKLNANKDLTAHPDTAAKAGDVNAMGLIDEILHHVIALYRAQELPSLYHNLEDALLAEMGKRKLDKVIRTFVRDFPPTPVYQRQTTAAEYLAQESIGISNRSRVLEEILMLWLGNQNPAYQPYLELFDDSRLREESAYDEMMDQMDAYFSAQSTFGPDNQSLVDMLRSPAIAAPLSLRGQLDYIRTRWGELLGHYLLKLLGSLNLILEEEHPRGLGPGPVRIPVYTGDPAQMEAERFSPDADWMPRLVLMAKNTYVWLDQLSKRYGRLISTLDEIPDEELARLETWGFTGLWLIGLWERSKASARIKQLCGNPEAIASAYSLKDYRIADDLGGEAALENLRARCTAHHIRLASDMVPNHMAIDSNWVYEHPDWFISLNYPPFPSYTFNGPNLSEDPRGDIFIEDHYYDRTDAAVVFKYHDRGKHQDHYIYHGNDGTTMPWNDTAQLNYLDPNVREAVIQTILDVARRFPVIRFDAAMTLAKRHYQRLWYPLPGGGCDIPSRSDHGMPQQVFDQYIPEEFWREVVDRVAAEAPDTLLLAEAFWLMEGYFVRTLGMHRVYNSAFMNLLRDEDNAKYRQVMKNTLEFDPEILKRYVNFMNNPDEETAANQFGKENKYFGICTLMATMPGMPMFGHGQVEGLMEKYGMEYKRAYWDEQPDQQLIDQHIWRIFPLLKRRYLFANVDQFYLYDFYDQSGAVDENVFAYSNIFSGERSLVVYYNRFGDTAGWVRTSAAFMDKKLGVLRTVDLQTGLDLPDDQRSFVIFRDQLNGLEYIRNCAEIKEKGLFIQMDAYRAHVFLGFQVVRDDAHHHWREVHDHLRGRGTSDIHMLQWELPLQPVLKPLREIANAGNFHYLLEQKPRVFNGQIPDAVVNEGEHKLRNLIRGAEAILQKESQSEGACDTFRRRLSALYQFEWLDQLRKDAQVTELEQLATWLRGYRDTDLWLVQVCWIYLDCLRSALEMEADEFLQISQEWRLFGVIETALDESGMLHGTAQDVTRAIITLFHLDGWHQRMDEKKILPWLSHWTENAFNRNFLAVHEQDGSTWFRKENMERLLTLMAFSAVSAILQVYNPGTKRAHERLEKATGMIMQLVQRANDCGFDLAQFLNGAD